VPEDKMSSKLLIPVFCALAIFAVGAGVEPIVANEREADPVAYAQVLAATPALRVMPTVTVVAETGGESAADTDHEGSVVLANVQRAGGEIAHRVNSGVRRVGLAVPYYAFGGIARRASE
jgi:hypothetical protein